MQQAALWAPLELWRLWRLPAADPERDADLLTYRRAVADACPQLFPVLSSPRSPLHFDVLEGGGSL